MTPRLPTDRRVVIDRLLGQFTGYPFHQFSLEDFAHYLQTHWYPHPLHLIRFPVTTPKPIGLCARQPHQTVVMVATHPALHPRLQDYVGLHEFAHLLLQHPMQEVRTVFAQAPYDSPQQRRYEQEADYLATQLLQLVMAHTPLPTQPTTLLPEMPLLVQAWAFED